MREWVTHGTTVCLMCVLSGASDKSTVDSVWNVLNTFALPPLSSVETEEQAWRMPEPGQPQANFHSYFFFTEIKTTQGINQSMHTGDGCLLLFVLYSST